MALHLPLPPDPSSGRPFVVTGAFGEPRANGPHQGLDLATRDERGRPTTGRPVYAMESGVLVDWGQDARSGLWLTYDDVAGRRWTYAHLEELGATMHRGRELRAGERVATSGATGRVTGPHLHLEVEVGGRLVDPLPFVEAAAGVRRGGGGVFPVVAGVGLTAALGRLAGWW